MSFDNRRRERTPTSPSPSPEPADGRAGTATDAGDGNARAMGTEQTGGMSAQAQEHMTEDSPMEAARGVLEARIRVAVDDLMQLAVCAAEVNEGDEDIVRNKVNETMGSLQALQDAADLPDLTHLIPEEVMGIIDPGRNPDAHTRSFANRLNSDNQQMRGQAENFDLYRGRLRTKLAQAFPEMQGDLDALDANLRQESQGQAA